MSALAELFAGLDEAEVEGRRPKLEEGSFILTVDATKIADGYNAGGQVFVIECLIDECLTQVLADRFPKGKEISCTINRLQDPKKENRDLALGNLKSFLSAAFSYKTGQYIPPDSQQKWVQLAMMCAQNQEILRGCKIAVQCDWIETKRSKDSKNPKDRFLKHNYRALNAPKVAA